MTPMIVPSSVRNERSLLARSAARAIPELSRRFTIPPVRRTAPAGPERRCCAALSRHARRLAGRLPQVALDLAVPHAHHPACMRGDVLLVRHQDHGVALLPDALE